MMIMIIIKSLTKSLITSNLKWFNLVLCKRCIQTIKIGVIGSGPAGFYTTQALLKNSKVMVDIYEKSPVPFGLIRFGVAPDHQSVKNVIHSFTSTALSKRVCFYGNIDIGRDVKLDELRQAYHAIVLCYGSSHDRTLNINGEELANVLPAKRFVGWYNGVPEDSKLNVNLNTDTVVIIGHGNVAIDCARILLSPVESSLKSTDITNHALNALKSSKVKNVYVVGRRGPLQVAFALKEFRELTKINNVDTIIPSSEFEHISIDCINSLPRPRKRLSHFLYQLSKERKLNKDNRKCLFLFQKSPTEIRGDKEDKVESIVLGINKLDSIDDENAQAILTPEREIIKCGLVLRCIGFKSSPIDPSIPVDPRSGLIKNNNGRVCDSGFGLYCSGWAANGATGVIASTMNVSFEVAATILQDMEANECNLKEKGGSDDILSLLNSRNVQVVTFDDWQKIDQLETQLGQKVGKPREKLIDETEILKAINKSGTD